MASRLRLEIDDRVATVWIEPAGGAGTGTLGRETLADLEAVLAELAAPGGTAALAGVVVTAAGAAGFLTGPDLEELGELETPERLAGFSARGQELLERWEALTVPTVAAIDGPALGPGLELALACTWRVASAARATVLGLPDVQLGLIPAFGGTQRLPRQIGLARGVRMLLRGETLRAPEALRGGLVDEVVAPPVLQLAARRWLARGRRRPRHSLRERLVAGSAVGRSAVLRAARQRVLARNAGRHPALLALLEAVEAGLSGGRAAGLAAECELFGELAATPVARRLIGLSRAAMELAAGERDTEGGGRQPVGVVGAGLMGSGIAAAAARAGHPVRLVDASPEALGRGLASCARTFRSLAVRGELTPEEARAAFARLRPALAADGLRHAELIVEAVVEDEWVKRELLRHLEAAASPSVVLASNTSTIPIARLAGSLREPRRMIGLHFFSPVERMALVEVIRHPGSSEEAVERGRAFARRLGKTPIVVGDGPGFYTTRILSPYLVEGVRLLRAGCPIEAIDGAGRAAGFPVGPLELLDEVGTDVAAAAAGTMAAAFPERMPAPDDLLRLVAQGRLGRKSGRGFYDHAGARKRPDAGVRAVLVIERSGDARADERDIAGRLLWAMTAEAVRCLEDGILTRPLEGDIGAVLGLGFPAFRGGPFRYLDAVGADEAVRRLEELARRHGPAFEPPQTLRQMATSRGSFY